MRKFTLTFLILILVHTSEAQVKIGAYILPAISVNRVSSESDSLSFNNNGVGYRIALALGFDIEMKKNYHFNTGLTWLPKRISLQMEEGETTTLRTFKVQYMQIPFNFKLLTDEFSIDKWFYFQIGLAFEFKISESGSHLEDLYIDKLNFFDIVLDPGFGLEMKLGQNTTLVSGITYYRGLLNAAMPQSFLKGDLKVKNDFWALNLGIKF